MFLQSKTIETYGKQTLFLIFRSLPKTKICQCPLSPAARTSLPLPSPAAQPPPPHTHTHTHCVPGGPKNPTCLPVPRKGQVNYESYYSPSQYARIIYTLPVDYGSTALLLVVVVHNSKCNQDICIDILPHFVRLAPVVQWQNPTFPCSPILARRKLVGPRVRFSAGAYIFLLFIPHQ